MPPPTVTAESWIILDGQSHEVLFARHEHKQDTVTSLAMLMTAYCVFLIADKLEIDMAREEVKIESMAVRWSGGESAFLNPGDILTVRELMHGMLV